MTSRLFTKKKPKVFSQNSTPAVPNSLWFASDFLLGAGMVLIQEESQKVAVVYDTNAKNWFLPKGRKDVGESLEDAALREAYEEVGNMSLISNSTREDLTCRGHEVGVQSYLPPTL